MRLKVELQLRRLLIFQRFVHKTFEDLNFDLNFKPLIFDIEKQTVSYLFAFSPHERRILWWDCLCTRKYKILPVLHRTEWKYVHIFIYRCIGDLRYCPLRRERARLTLYCMSYCGPLSDRCSFIVGGRSVIRGDVSTTIYLLLSCRRAIGFYVIFPFASIHHIRNLWLCFLWPFYVKKYWF